MGSHARQPPEWARQIFLETILEASPDLLVAVDAMGTIVFTNETTEKMFGYEPGELIGKPIEVLVPESIRSRHVGMRNEYIAAPQARKLGTGRDLQGRRKDGTLFPVEISLFPRKTDKGLFVLASVIDISARKAAEVRLRESEERLRTLINATPDCIFFKDGDGRWLEINTTAEELFGLKYIDFRGKRDCEIAEILPAHSSALAYCETTDEMAWQNRAPTWGEETIQKSDGTMSVLEVVKTPIFHPDGRRKWLVAAGRDITKRRLIENDREKLLAQEKESVLLLQKERSHARFLAEFGRATSESLEPNTTLHNIARLSATHLADWCLVISTQVSPHRLALAHAETGKEPLLCELGRQLEANGALAGASAAMDTRAPVIVSNISDEMLQDPASPVVAGPQNPGLLATIRRLGMRSYLAIPLIARARTLGAIMFVSTSLPERYSSEELRMAQDLAYRAALALDNAQLYDESRREIARREEFLSIASHELKTPITSLNMQLQLLRKLLDGESFSAHPGISSVTHLLDGSLTELDHFLRLIENLLDVTRISIGKPSLELEEVDLSALVRDVARRYRLKVVEAGSTLEVRADRPILGLWDPIRLEQVLLNLLTNAVKFASGKPIEVETSFEEQTARITVRDHGIGIAKEDQGRIFGRFERAASPVKARGVGLGLFIARQIVQAHEGSIRVESTPGQGSTFIVALPLRTPARKAA